MVPETVASLFIVSDLELVPPEMLNPIDAGIRDKPLIVLFVNASVPASVANVPAVGKIRLVVLVVLKVISAPEPLPMIQKPTKLETIDDKISTKQWCHIVDTLPIEGLGTSALSNSIVISKSESFLHLEINPFNSCDDKSSN